MKKLTFLGLLLCSAHLLGVDSKSENRNDTSLSPPVEHNSTSTPTRVTPTPEERTAASRSIQITSRSENHTSKAQTASFSPSQSTCDSPKPPVNTEPKSSSTTEFQPISFHDLIDKVPSINKELWEVHFQLYKGYVKQVNLLNRLLEEERAKPKGDQSLLFQLIKRNFGWEYDGMVLHELFFSNLGSKVAISKSSALYKKINEKWGSFDKWFNDFKQTSMERGVGWTILYFDPIRDMLYIDWVTDHATGPLIGAAPLLVIDMWEHAYLCQFKTNKGAYIDTIFDYVNWSVVNQRLKNASCAPKATKSRISKQPKGRHKEKMTVKKST